MAATERPVVPDLRFLHISNDYNPKSASELAQVSDNPNSVTITDTENVLEDSKHTSEAKPPTFELEEHPIDEVRPIKVGVIGAGIAGVTAGVLLSPKLPGLDLRIYDKNADVVSCLLLVF